MGDLHKVIPTRPISILPNVRSIITILGIFLFLIVQADDTYPNYWYEYLDTWTSSVLWIVIVGFILAFALSFAVGANDCANSLGTAVGSGTMTLRMACILGSICETLGAVFLSGNVISKLTTGIIDIDMYKTNFTYVNTTECSTQDAYCWDVKPAFPVDSNDNSTNWYALDPEKQLMLGEIGVITGSAIWQIIASYMAWPVSGTHSVVGGILGFSLVANGNKGVDWWELGKIALSWVASPLLASILSMALYYPIRRWIVMADDPLKFGKIAFPIFWGVAALINAGLILTTGNTFVDLFNMDKNALWGIAAGIGAVTTLLIGISVYFDWWKFEELRQNKENETKPAGNSNPAFDAKVDTVQISDEKSEVPDIDEDTPETRRIFESLQYVSACSGALAHGGNDVGNAIGPIVLLWLLYNNPITFDTESAPYWVLLYGGFGISVGLWILGHKTIQTIGSDLAKMTPSRGFSVEIMSAIVMQLGSALGIPLSSTHCKVGSVVGIGFIRGRNEVDFKLFRSIAAAWVITVPAAGLISAAVYYILYVIVF